MRVLHGSLATLSLTGTQALPLGAQAADEATINVHLSGRHLPAGRRASINLPPAEAAA